MTLISFTFSDFLFSFILLFIYYSRYVYRLFQTLVSRSSGPSDPPLSCVWDLGSNVPNAGPTPNDVEPAH